ncbi:Gfo/Idh/MocA family oxidoreductase [Alkalihalobacillus sp. MEB130]|uniref:Gfo/Idh/MocA family protein n=1 Tax=Alkalihalobacillus sp. MEB130 TaxID=2976704 RepID=UPI0028DDBCCA|nr:Gfo/Idh/MocA family oxidoreductase [Alkalihalobacillus sp. MEB130]MDT8860129.1 Gfo/Idh/MocA family oxidoreductase [Alkalihalobacillus sp. MEB130]
MKTVKWGILSAANIAFDQVVPAIRRSSNSEVVAVASKSRGKAERFQVPKIYESYEQLLDDREIDAIYIPLPNSLHAEWAIKAAEKGKHVLLEKPATVNVDQLLEIERVTNEKNVIFMEAFMYQFHRQHQRLQELLKSPIIGDPSHFNAHFSHLVTDPNDIRANKDLSGGALMDVGCYGVHAMAHIFGMKPTSVSMVAKKHPEWNVDSLSTSVFIDEQGRTASITSSLELAFINYYEIVGSKGRILVESSFRPDENHDNLGKIIVRDEQNRVILMEAIEDDQYVNMIEHFQNCITQNMKIQYSLRDSLRTIHYIEESYESWKHSSSLRKLKY